MSAPCFGNLVPVIEDGTLAPAIMQRHILKPCGFQQIDQSEIVDPPHAQHEIDVMRLHEGMVYQTLDRLRPDFLAAAAPYPDIATLPQVLHGPNDRLVRPILYGSGEVLVPPPLIPPVIQNVLPVIGQRQRAIEIKNVNQPSHLLSWQ